MRSIVVILTSAGAMLGAAGCSGADPTGAISEEVRSGHNRIELRLRRIELRLRRIELQLRRIELRLRGRQ